MPQKTRKKPPTGKKVCTLCKKEKTLLNFYEASNPATSSDGKTVDVCKNCIKKKSLNPDGSLNMDNFKESLMLMDKPFAKAALDAAVKETKIAIENNKGRKDLIGNYMKNIASLPQYAKLSFLQSMQVAEGGVLSAATPIVGKVSDKKDEEIYISPIDDFVVTDEMINLFGEGYSRKMYHLMFKKYEKLKQNYILKTSMHEESLATYVSRKVRAEIATAEGNVDEADKWGKAADKAAVDGKLTPKQLSETDLQGGLANFSDIFRAVEEAEERIPILPEFKYRPNDAIDFIIWCYINYERNLNNMPEVEYSEIYKFYDEKKNEYIEQYGDPYSIFDGDTTESNRESIEKFITIPIEFRDGD